MANAPRSVCFISSKGGSGKTVTASSLATFLSELGFSVLLVDTDAATNGMTLLYLEQLLGNRTDLRGVGIFEYDGASSLSKIKVTETLTLVPATLQLRDTEGADISRFKFALEAILRESVDRYNFVLFDAQAGTDQYAREAAGIVDLRVIVSEYDPVSAQGTDRMKILFSDIMDPPTTWILFNKILPEFASVVGDGLAIARYLPPVPWDADVIRAFVRRDLAINTEAPNPYTLAISQVAFQLFPDEAGEKIREWAKSTIGTTQEPLKRKKEELETMMAAVIKNEKFRQSSLSLGLLIMFIFSAGVYFLSIFEYVYGRSVDLIFGINFSTVETLSFASALLLMVNMVVYLVFSLRSRKFDKNDASAVAVNLLRRQVDQIDTAMTANESIVKFSEEAGKYERQRAKHARSSGP